MSKVELVVATYPGGEKYLAETMESLYAQKGVDFSAEVVNDFRYGPDKWNEAFDKCQSEFIGFPHHDDLYQPEWLAESVAALESNREAVACFSMDTFINGEGRRMPGGTTLPVPEQDTYDFKTIINAMIRHGNFLRCPSVVFHRALVGDMRFDAPGTGTAIDTAFWFKLLSVHPIVIINKPLVRYRQTTTQDSQSQRVANKGIDHWDAMKYAASLRPEDVEWDNHIALSKMIALNDIQKEMERVKKKAKEEKAKKDAQEKEKKAKAETEKKAAEEKEKLAKAETEKKSAIEREVKKALEEAAKAPTQEDE